MNHTDAYKQGYNFFYHPSPDKRNPYIQGTQNYIDWEKGFSDGAQEEYEDMMDVPNNLFR